MHPILQFESAVCGLACLVMVSNAHGLRLDLSEVRRRFAVSLKGANLQQHITRAAQGQNARSLIMQGE